MKQWRRQLTDESATVALGKCLGNVAEGGAVVYLQGHLGAGKTTFCRGVLRALGHTGAVKSPTYTLVELYDSGSRKLYHFDLYRLGDPEELEYMGIRDYFADDALCLIEWPERGTGVLPAADLIVQLRAVNGGRMAEFRAQSRTGEKLLEDLSMQKGGGR